MSHVTFVRSSLLFHHSVVPLLAAVDCWGGKVDDIKSCDQARGQLVYAVAVRSAQQQAGARSSARGAWGRPVLIEDVSRRYAPSWNKALLKLRAAEPWWQFAVAAASAQSVSRRDQLMRARSEQAMVQRVKAEPLPTSLAACKKSTMYCIEAHLRQTDLLHPAKVIFLLIGS